GLHTWVKELPVFAHLVTEAQSFNMPVRPQIRLLSEWNNTAGLSVFFDETTETDFSFASTTNIILLMATSTPTSTLNQSLEYEYIPSRIASSSEEAAVLEQFRRYQSERFGFATNVPLIATTTATTTKENEDMRLYEDSGDVYVDWIGGQNDIPYYFCVTNK